jgi:DNA-directed RNA polymerase specialized sigma24 family protein
VSNASHPVRTRRPPVPLEVEFTSESVPARADAAMLLCPSVEVAKQVSQTVHWLLGTAAYRAERRAKAVLDAEDWLNECLVKAARQGSQFSSMTCKTS